MNIDIQYVWAGIIGYAALSLLAMAFIRGADERRDARRNGSTRVEVGA
ncbi:hypothetical protein [Paraburkholderia antibiotica]|uniref:Uncharacterized protein n=1 Tax=Paraburkholderia antibiotica TaxID=2728839 RepID=A0A7Y0A1Q6_9BURK|nr:hypothetical protein [Paraburkholderia antibiotica]NML34901.1 hypothetical protein [Paraburkholderia antibiotica]